MSTAATVDLLPVLAELDLTLSGFARSLGISKGVAHRLLRQGTWPARSAAQTQRAVAALLHARRAGAGAWAAFRAIGLFTTTAPTSRKAPPMDQIGEAPSPATPEAASQPLEDPMLLECTRLTEKAKKAWNLPRDPFVNDVTSREDVLASPSIRRVRAALLDCAMHHDFIAVIGESGSGKSTLRKELEQRIIDEGRPIIVIKPYVLGMDKDETKGKPMKSGQIGEAVARTIAPSVQLKSRPDAHAAQLHDMLRDSARAGNRHLLLIEEAHRLPLATIRHLKGWLELEDGMRRLLGICLIGQTELDSRLSETQKDIREVVQRCEKIFMEPLDEALPAYLKLKFERVGVDVGAVLADDAYDALRARLIQVDRGRKVEDGYSVCYPLAVNNHVARAMNAAAHAGWPRVDAQAVAGS